MTRKLIVHPRVEAQAGGARDWYDAQRPGLGDRFVDELEVAVKKAHEPPLLSQKVHTEIRRILMRRFPYAIFFVSTESQVSVLGLLRQSENPEKWGHL